MYYTHFYLTKIRNTKLYALFNLICCIMVGIDYNIMHKKELKIKETLIRIFDNYSGLHNSYACGD